MVTGSIDALYSAITEISDIDIKLIEYNINSISRGKEALGKVKSQVEYRGEKIVAKTTGTDIMKASAFEYGSTEVVTVGLRSKSSCTWIFLSYFKKRSMIFI